jgi:ribosomal protein L37AE/L43A
MTAPPPYVPPDLIPDETKTLGEPQSLGPEISEEERRRAHERAEEAREKVRERAEGASTHLGPRISKEERQRARERERERERNSPGACPECGSLEIETRRRGWFRCSQCDNTRASPKQRRREKRLREAHNDGSFMPLSPSEWRERREP